MKNKWRWFWLAMFILGLGAAARLLSMPSESGKAILFGLSIYKLAMAAGMLLISVLCLLLSLKQNTWLSEETQLRIIGGLTLFFAFALVLGKIFLSPPIGITAFVRSIRTRIMPLAIWMAGFVLASLIMLLLSQRKELHSALDRVKTGCPAGFVLLLLMSIVIFIGLKTGLGMEIISGTFYRQGISLLEGHLVIPLLALFPLCILFALIDRNRQIIRNTRIPEVILPIVIWFAAERIWRNVPFEGRSYFLPALRPPNYNFYPSSDSENYDMLAQSILLGNGFRNGMTVVRPLYVAFLALLHKIAGNDYMQVTDLQIMVMALFPVCVYLIGRKVNRKEAGILAAAWVIWREVYSIRVTPLVQVSNVRLLMSDMPTALSVSVMILCGILWTERRKSVSRALLLGGSIGIAMLIRTQTFVLLAGAILLIFACCINWKHFFRMTALCLLGVAVVFGPWTVWNMTHPNESLTGETSEGNYLIKLYERAAGLEMKAEHSLPDLILHYPSEITSAVSAHFFNNEIGSLLVLPEREIPVEDAEQFLFEGNLFWYRESSEAVLRKNIPLTVLYICLISLGCGIAFGCRKWCGVFPLLIHVIYNAGNSLAMTSGFRFILPVDWVILLYFAFGCTGLLRALVLYCLRMVSAVPEEETAGDTRPVHAVSLTAVGLVLLAFGLILPVCDGGIPRHFSNDTDEQLLERWMEAADDLSGSEKESLLKDIESGRYIITEGRALYPRYYKHNEGDSGGGNRAEEGNGQERLVWLFLNDTHTTIALNCGPEAALTPIPDPMNVILVGEQLDGYIQVLSMAPSAKESD